jgi:hypothetical protein
MCVAFATLHYIYKLIISLLDPSLIDRQGYKVSVYGVSTAVSSTRTRLELEGGHQGTRAVEVASMSSRLPGRNSR